MTKQTRGAAQVKLNRPINKHSTIQRRRPFWLPAMSFYVLSLAASAGTFFLLWGILHDGKNETPWVEAGLAASIVLGSAVFLREIILRNARERYFNEQRKLDHSLRPAFTSRPAYDQSKFSLEQNAEMLKNIETKSAAARVLARLSDAHREVFDLCEQYLILIENEIPNVAPGSPRIAAFNRGKRKVRELHHYHLMQTVEIESKTLTGSSQLSKSSTDKIEAVERTKELVDSALKYYPADLTLNESKNFLIGLVSSLYIMSEMEFAEKAEKKGDIDNALKHYQDALSKLKIHSDSALIDMDIAEELQMNVTRLKEQTEVL